MFGSPSGLLKLVIYVRRWSINLGLNTEQVYQEAKTRKFGGGSFLRNRNVLSPPSNKSFVAKGCKLRKTEIHLFGCFLAAPSVDKELSGRKGQFIFSFPYLSLQYFAELTVCLTDPFSEGAHQH